MTQDWKAAKRLFTKVIELEPSLRAAFLQEYCPSDAIRKEVESLLAHHEPAKCGLGIKSSIGGKLLSHYRILEQIGAGGMGLVYKAHDEQLNRLVAIKVLLPWAIDDPVSRARLLEEARYLGALSHPHIVTVYQMARERDIDLVVMEYVDGKTLDEHIPVRGLALAKALDWALQIGNALEAAHAIGILHRDLKPSNIMVTRDGRVKLLDFGLALRIGGKSAPAEFGTKAFMAPELLAGNTVSDCRSEIFSFGLVVYQMLTGKMTFTEIPEKSNREGRPVHWPVRLKGHVELAQTVRKCLEADPNLRFQSMAEVLSALKNTAILHRPSGPREDPSDVAEDPQAIREIRSELRRFGYSNLADSRRAFARLIRILNGTASDRVRQIVSSAMRKLILVQPDSNGVVTMPVREVRKLAFDLLLAATQDELRSLELNDLECLDLYGMNFGGLSLNRMSFQNSFLVEADFRQTALQNASLSGASIRNANFAGADLTDCDLTDADWFHALGLTEEQLSVARKSTLRSCPSTVSEMHDHLAARYLFPFSSWADRVQEEIVAAWATYLRPGGLRDKVAQWRG
jgi:serine/threonine protein kinase